MSTYRVLAMGLAVIATINLTGCGARDLNYKKVEVDELKKEIRDLEAQLDACEKRKVDSIYQAAGNDHVGAQHAALPGVDISDRPMEHVLSIESNVLFAPGSAKLTSEAKATLSRVIAVIQKEYPNHLVRVDGFTDNSKISRTKDKWDDNWDLSGGRAQAVLHYLLDHGVNAADLGFAGFGEQRTKVPNTSEANKSKNRRVEIVVIPKH